jgi:TRAP-type mannitol/chloroaromatic compound transport system permease large subunit
MEKNNINNEIIIKNGLKRIRLIRFLWYSIWASFIPFAFLAVTLQPPTWIFIGISSIWCASLLVLGLIHSFIRCPSCKKTFNVRGLTAFGCTQKCMHCGLPLKLLKPETEV